MFFDKTGAPFSAPKGGPRYYSNNDAQEAYKNLRDFCSLNAPPEDSIPSRELFEKLHSTHYHSMNLEPLYGSSKRGEYCDVLLNMNWWYYHGDEVRNLWMLSGVVLVCIFITIFLYRKRKPIMATGKDVVTSGLAAGIRAKRCVSKRASEIAEEAKRKS